MDEFKVSQLHAIAVEYFSNKRQEFMCLEHVKGKIVAVIKEDGKVKRIDFEKKVLNKYIEEKRERDNFEYGRY